MNFLRLIRRLDIYKYREETISFKEDGDKAYKSLLNGIKNMKPSIIKLSNDYTVLATKLLVDSNNMNKIKVEVYDPNYSGQIKYLDIDRYLVFDEENNSTKYEYKVYYQGINCDALISIPNLAANL